MTPLVNRAQMQDLERLAIEQVGIPSAVLMENAGRGVVDALFHLHALAKINLQIGQTVVLVGVGNNGGDGLVTARYLHNRGIRTRVILCGKREELKKEAQLYLQIAVGCGVLVHDYQDAKQVEELLFNLQSHDIIIDALFGIGLKGAVRGDLARVIRAINQSSAYSIAIDLPSGLDADHGVFPDGAWVTGEDAELASSLAIVTADHTVTFGFPKIAMCMSPGYLYVGELTIVDIGLPPILQQSIKIEAQLLDANCLLPLFNPLHPLAHKGLHGHLLVMAGSLGKTGAALLAAQAAIEVGVGLCHLFVPEEIFTAIQGLIPEAISTAYPFPEKNVINQHAVEVTRKKQALVLGPGISADTKMQSFLEEILLNDTSPVVLDADALNLCSTWSEEMWKRVTAQRPVILTPHPKEASRLLKKTVEQVQTDRQCSAMALAEQTGAIVVLKGARTIVATPTTMQARYKVSVCPTGNAAMGTAGMGDVLAGMIGALLARGITPYEATCAAVYWHGLTGDDLVKTKAQGSLLHASELTKALQTTLLKTVATPSV